MESKALRTGLRAAIAIAILGLPAAAGAQRVVPPGNSAATQYTQTFPTGGGNSPTRHHGHRSPAKVLGARTVRRLQAAGPTGSAAANLAAATAPRATRAGGPGATQATPRAPHGAVPAGSSGLRKVLTQATGSSDSGELGLLLPLLILAAVSGSAVYFWRHRHRTA
jgi:hypothetical protein